uniref:Zinc transporter foi n=1 Tax=Glossina brevipalpis TaxID=37001 RepID=A0A1A9WQ12_9MUSC
MASSRKTLISILSVACFLFINVTKIKASAEYNRYLAHIFQKYGDGGTMTFEGLEHLMYSLGLGQIEFDATHTIDEHRPNGYEKRSENESIIKSFIEEQTVKLLSEDNDVQIEDDQINRYIKNRKASQSLDDNHKKQDIIRVKGVILEFKEMHDPKHRHPREDDTFHGASISDSVCLSPKSLLRLVVNHDDLHSRKLYKTFMSSRSDDAAPLAVEKFESHNSEEEYNDFINNVHLTPVAFMKLCPALLAQIDQQVCRKPAPPNHIKETGKLQWSVWIYAGISIFILSASGLLGILLVPIMKTVIHQEILSFLIAVAIGTLSGDAFMHLLPHALVDDHGTPNHNDITNELHHDNSAVWICACAFFTAFFMYIIENLVPWLKDDSELHIPHYQHNHNHHQHHHSHHHDHSNKTQQPTSEAVPTNGESSSTGTKEVRELNIMLNETKIDVKAPSKPLSPVAFMVIIGDGLHNLTDGLAIGAAFASDPITGLATTFAVLCHELPHELGDFALLLQTGVSLRRAVYLNIISSILSFVGMAVGLLVAGMHSNMTKWIYAGTAGSFLYIAYADLLPTMAEENQKSLKSSLIQTFGILIGGLIMIVIAVNEHDLERLFQ